MAPYQERADPQTIGTLPLMVSPGQIPEALKEHAVQLGKYGPPPPNFSVAHKRRQPPAFWKNRDYWPTSPWYRELSDVGEGNWYHPLSPVGLALNPKLDPEPDRPSAPKPGYKKKAPGWFDPPLIYKAGDWTWQHFKTWQGALADSLTVRGYVYLRQLLAVVAFWCCRLSVEQKTYLNPADSYLQSLGTAPQVITTSPKPLSIGVFSRQIPKVTRTMPFIILAMKTC